MKGEQNKAIAPDPEIAALRSVTEIAKELNEKGFQKIDSLHIACAIITKCEYFLTTDDKILKLARVLNDIKINDPIGFVKETLS